MARYIDVSEYEDCRIVANAEDVGVAVEELPTYEKRLEKGDKVYQVDNATICRSQSLRNFCRRYQNDRA